MGGAGGCGKCSGLFVGRRSRVTFTEPDHVWIGSLVVGNLVLTGGIGIADDQFEVFRNGNLSIGFVLIIGAEAFWVEGCPICTAVAVLGIV